MKTLGLRFFYLSLIIACPSFVFAQDVQYSQYNYTPTLVNPAFVGAMDHSQVIFNYRTQWRSIDQKFNTPLITAIVPFVNKSGYRKGGLGVSAISDKSSYFQNTGATLTLAYNLYLNKKLNLSFGAGAGYYQRSLSGDGLTTGSQYQTSTGFNSNLPTGEDMTSMNKNYLDLNAGLLLYQYDSLYSRRKFYLGVSGYHLSQPDISLTASATDKLPLKIVGTAGYMILSKKSISITPEILYTRTNNFNRLMAGAVFSYYLNDKNSKLTKNARIDFVSRYSTGNAIILALQLNKEAFNLGFSYDITSGRLSQFNNYKGAAEVMITLRIPSKKKNQIPESDYTLGEVREFTRSDNNGDNQVDNTKGYLFHLEEVINYNFNDTILSEIAKKQLIDIANLLKGNKFLKIKVVGHSDNLGTERANRRISEERAKIASEFLMQNGIDKKRISVVGRGSDEPVATNNTEEGRAKNRRVEFIIYK